MKSGIPIDAEARVNSDANLTVGAASESVEVVASSAVVQTDSAQVGTTIETKQIQDLTLNGRNPIYLAALSPGVIGGTIGTLIPTASATAASISTAGAPTSMSWSSMARWPRGRAHRDRWSVRWMSIPWRRHR